MRFWLGGWAAFAAFVGSSIVSPVCAETTFRQRAEYFDISGFVNSRKEMWDAIRDWGPSGVGGRLIVGTAQPRFGYSYKFKKQGGQCFVTEMKVSVGVVLRLPQWNAKAFAKPELQQYFDCILRTVTVHEKRHGQIAYETGQQIERTMLSELDGSSCTGFKDRADTIFRRVIAKGGVRQSDFDRRDYARRRYQQCYNSSGPKVDLNANDYRRSAAWKRPPTRRFDTEPPKRQKAKRVKHKPAVEPTRQTIDAADSIEKVSSALNGFRFAAKLGALLCAAFALSMWWAVCHERKKEFGLGVREPDMAMASAGNSRPSPVVRQAQGAAAWRTKLGFGKRSR